MLYVRRHFMLYVTAVNLSHNKHKTHFRHSFEFLSLIHWFL